MTTQSDDREIQGQMYVYTVYENVGWDHQKWGINVSKKYKLDMSGNLERQHVVSVLDKLVNHHVTHLNPMNLGFIVLY